MGWDEPREQLRIRALSSGVRDRYERELRDVQRHFVDDPSGAVRKADRLAQQAMRERGFPVEDFEQHAADVAVDYPHVVAYYRLAHGVSTANERGQASTQDLRQALVHYRLLFNDLLGAGAEDEPLTRDTTDART
jgi:hypothetical protein